MHMTRFLAHDELHWRIAAVVDGARKELVIVSPSIYLHEKIQERLRSKIEEPELKVIVVFGQQPRNGRSGIRAEDLAFFKTFQHVEVRYEERLNARYYANEDIGIATSLDLSDFSEKNTVEFGIEMRSTVSGKVITSLTGDGEAEDVAAAYFANVVKHSELYFQRVPQYEKHWAGLTKKYLGSEIVVDRSAELNLAV
jgi:hypothetical protein